MSVHETRCGSESRWRSSGCSRVDPAFPQRTSPKFARGAAGKTRVSHWQAIRDELTIAKNRGRAARVARPATRRRSGTGRRGVDHAQRRHGPLHERQVRGALQGSSQGEVEPASAEGRPGKEAAGPNKIELSSRRHPQKSPNPARWPRAPRNNAADLYRRIYHFGTQ